MMFGLSALYTKLIGAGVALALLAGVWGLWSWRGHELATARSLAASEAVQIANLQAQAQHAAKVQAISDDASAKAAAAQSFIQASTNADLVKVKSHVTAQDDATCHVSPGLVGLLDHAAGVMPDHAVSAPAGKPDDAASAVALSDLASVTIANDGIARSTARQLADLQAWIVAQEAAAP